MAVNSISRIQIRRGRRENLPQLNAGELGWAVDTQQLYIGNGTLDDGAPAEGNTEIITTRNLPSLTNNFQVVTLLDAATSPAVTFYTYDYATHPAGVINYSIVRNGAYRSGTLQFAYDGAGNVDINDTYAGDSLGVNLSMTISGNMILVQYTTTSTGYVATLKYLRVDYL